MSKEISTAVFDYSELDKDTKSMLISLAGTIRKEREKHTDAGFEIGKAVACAHAKLASEGKDSQFSQWVERECGFSRQTAYNYMWAWEKFGNCKTVLQFDAGALYALASPKAPPAAAKEAEKLASKGEKITLDKAKELLDRFREVAKKPPSKPAEQPRSATSAGTESPASTPDLPTEGTVNQAEHGAQGTGAQAGDCIRGGDHDYDDEACRKCHDPKPATGKPSGGTTFNPAEWADSDLTDSLGHPVPADLVPAFGIVAEINAQRAKLTALKTWITQSKSNPGAVLLLAAKQRIETDIDNADRELKFAAPYCPCVYCHNKAPKVADCNACKGLGWITETIYKSAPKGMKHGKAKG